MKLAGPVEDLFGEVTPPTPIAQLGFGAAGISQLLSNIVTLIYMAAAIIFVFMLITGAFEWLTSGGDKEKVDSARRRITNAIIGIVLFAVAFAIIELVGVFTGFTFFKT